jgi:DNA polymerase-4
VTIGDLVKAGLPRLSALLGSGQAEHVFELAQGHDDREVEPGRPAKSVGAEMTFEEDTADRRWLELRLLELSGRVARRLLKAGIAGKSVTVKLKYADFTLKTRQMSLRSPVADTDSIFGAAKTLLDRFVITGRGARLIGVAVGDLTEGLPESEPSLFPDTSERRLRLEAVVAKVADRFGGKGITRASLLGAGEDDEGREPDE